MYKLSVCLTYTRWFETKNSTETTNAKARKSAVSWEVDEVKKIVQRREKDKKLVILGGILFYLLALSQSSKSSKGGASSLYDENVNIGIIFVFFFWKWCQTFEW